MLQCVAVCCKEACALQGVAGCCGVLQGVVFLQYVAVRFLFSFSSFHVYVVVRCIRYSAVAVDCSGAVAVDCSAFLLSFHVCLLKIIGFFCKRAL